MRKYLLFTLLVVSAWLAMGAPVAAQSGGNLLQNASFDSPVYTPVSFDPKAPDIYLAVPEGWQGVVVQSPRSKPWMNVHPSGLPHVGGIKADGHRSYHVSRGGGTFTAYIFQRVSVQPGTPIEAGAWAFLESSTGEVRVGVDPTGGTNPFSPSVTWAGGASHFSWNTPQVNTTAEAGTVTMFLFATQSQPSDPNGVYWDAAYLRGTAGTAPETGSTGSATLEATVGRLNVRASPSMDARVLGIISAGNTYPVTESRSGWYGITYDSQQGFVSARYVNVTGNVPASGSAPASQTTAPAPEPSGVTFTTNAPLRIRNAPSTDAAEIGQIRWGATVDILGRTANGQWIQVRYDGKVGWSSSEYGVINGPWDGVPVTG